MKVQIFLYILHLDNCYKSWQIEPVIRLKCSSLLKIEGTTKKARNPFFVTNQTILNSLYAIWLRAHPIFSCAILQISV